MLVEAFSTLFGNLPGRSMKSLVPPLHDSTFLCLLILATLVWAGGVVCAAEIKTNESEWLRVLGGAKKEGKLSVFLYQRENIEAAVKAFEKKYPEIGVITASTPAAETGARLMAERRAGKFLWDVCICGPTTPFSVL